MQLENNGVIVYPNPSITGLFRYNSGNFPEGANNIEITDLTGRLIKNLSTSEAQSAELNLDTKGMYFVSIKNNEKTLFTQKVIFL